MSHLMRGQSLPPKTLKTKIFTSSKPNSPNLQPSGSNGVAVPETPVSSIYDALLKNSCDIEMLMSSPRRGEIRLGF